MKGARDLAVLALAAVLARSPAAAQTFSPEEIRFLKALPAHPTLGKVVAVALRINRPEGAISPAMDAKAFARVPGTPSGGPGSAVTRVFPDGAMPAAWEAERGAYEVSLSDPVECALVSAASKPGAKGGGRYRTVPASLPCSEISFARALTGPDARGAARVAVELSRAFGRPRRRWESRRHAGARFFAEWRLPSGAVLTHDSFEGIRVDFVRKR